MRRTILSSCLLAGSLLAACQSGQTPTENPSASTPGTPVADWPQAVTYEVFVQSFADSNADGIGDFNGLRSKLDYLADLGIKALWLMPINPSPSYHKYDVTDYYGVHPDYGTMEEFKQLVEEAHARDIKIVMDLVINHSGSDHPWFQQAMKDPNSRYRDWYVWANKDSVADQIAKKTTTLDSDNITQWHDVPPAYQTASNESYYGFFWGGMPDLNFDNPEVKQEMFKIGKFWLEEVGVDGFRLDAARHIFPDDRLEDNHRWWEEFRAEMEKVKPDVYLVGEVWESMEKVAPYLNGLHALFNFDLGYAITQAIQNGQGDDLVDKHIDIRNYYASVNPDYIDAIFLTNHDQNRILSELGGDPDKGKLAASILLSLPGSPYLYYGEEIGMLGKKPDENIREPFLWESKSDEARTSWMKPDFTTTETVRPLSEQMADSSSIYWHYKKLIRARNASKVLSLGDLQTAKTQEDGLLSFLRIADNDTLLVLHNLSDKYRHLELDDEEKALDQLYYQSEKAARLHKGQLELPAYSSLILSNE